MVLVPLKQCLLHSLILHTWLGGATSAHFSSTRCLWSVTHTGDFSFVGKAYNPCQRLNYSTIAFCLPLICTAVIFICIYIHMCAHVYIYIHICIYTHMHTYVYMCLSYYSIWYTLVSIILFTSGELVSIILFKVALCNGFELLSFSEKNIITKTKC